MVVDMPDVPKKSAEDIATAITMRIDLSFFSRKFLSINRKIIPIVNLDYLPLGIAPGAPHIPISVTNIYEECVT